MKYPTVIVSDHAIVRYLERHYGIDMDRTRAEILKIVEGPAKAGVSTYQWDNIRFHFKRAEDGQIHVATAMRRDMAYSRKQGSRGGR